MVWLAPIARKDAARSKPPPAASGGNSTILKMVPLRGGSSDMRRRAASALPALDAGAPLLTHRSVSAKSARPGSVSTWGDGASLTMMERPRASWPVMMRRIGLIMAASRPGLYTAPRLGETVGGRIPQPERETP
jgi:hypothetical protein